MSDDLVICIRDDWVPDYDLAVPVGSPIKGQVYTPLKVHERYFRDFYELRESPRSPLGGPTLWATDFFKPCRPTDISSIVSRVKEPA